MSRYVQIKYAEFKELMDIMGFTEIKIDGTFERVWSFSLKNTNFDILIYSTIDINTDVSRSMGSDAIRCLVYDRKETKILRLEKRVHRTESALINTRERCRELFRYVRSHKCLCGGILIQRTSKTNHKFLGCSNFPKCKLTKNQITSQLKLKLKS